MKKEKICNFQDVADRVGVDQNDGQPFLTGAGLRRAAGKQAALWMSFGYIPNQRLTFFPQRHLKSAIGVLAAVLTNRVFCGSVTRSIEVVTDAHGYQTMLAHYGYKLGWSRSA